MFDKSESCEGLREGQDCPLFENLAKAFWCPRESGQTRALLQDKFKDESNSLVRQETRILPYAREIRADWARQMKISETLKNHQVHRKRMKICRDVCIYERVLKYRNKSASPFGATRLRE